MRSIACLVLAAALAPAVLAQTPPAPDRLRIGSVELTLGMSEKSTLAALESHYQVVRARGTGDDWAVSEAGKTIAVVSFAADKLARASKTSYASSSRESAALSDALYSLASQFASDGHTQCMLSTKPYQAARAAGRIVAIACGAESIQLVETQLQAGGSAITLQEVLQ
jgi:D-aminopeptidase